MSTNLNRIVMLFVRVVFTVVVITTLPMVSAFAQDLPSRADIKSTMEKVYNYWRETNPDPGDAGWKQAVYYAGLMAMYDTLKDDNCRDDLHVWADANGWEKPYRYREYNFWDFQSSGTTLGKERFDIDDTHIRRLKIVGHGNTQNMWNSITEIEFADASNAPTCIASDYQPPNTPSNTLDNDFNTRWSAYGDNAWIACDLGTIALVRDVDIAFYKGDQRQAFFDIVISNDTHADDQICGQIYFDLNRYDPDFVRLISVLESVDAMVDRSRINDWWWIDAIFMAAPLFSRFGEEYGDDAYYDKLFQLYNHTKNQRKLFDAEEGLWYRDRNYLFPEHTTENGKKIFWLRGNGWVIAAMAGILAHLSPDHESHGEYLHMLRTMAAALKAYQRTDDGFWNVSLIDPDDYIKSDGPEYKLGPETSGTALITYALAWGINHGYLDRDTYLPVVVKAWNGMVEHAVHTDGRLGYVQDVAPSPYKSRPTYYSTTDFGVGLFLLAGSEVYRLNGPAITVSASSSQLPNIPENTLDNDLSTRWSALGPGEWIQYDLGEARWVRSVEIAFFKGDQRQAYFDIVLSEDGENWSDPPVYSGQSSGTTLEKILFDFKNVEARYLKIIGYGNSVNNWNSITEVKISLQ